MMGQCMVKTQDVSERMPTEGPQHWRKTMRRTARWGRRSAVARHRTQREQYWDRCSKLKEEVIQTFASMPSLICSSITITAWSLNIILQSINLIACDVWCVSVFAFEITIEGKEWKMVGICRKEKDSEIVLWSGDVVINAVQGRHQKGLYRNTIQNINSSGFVWWRMFALFNQNLPTTDKASE